MLFPNILYTKIVNGEAEANRVGDVFLHAGCAGDFKEPLGPQALLKEFVGNDLDL